MDSSSLSEAVVSGVDFVEALSFVGSTPEGFLARPWKVRGGVAMGDFVLRRCARGGFFSWPLIFVIGYVMKGR